MVGDESSTGSRGGFRSRLHYFLYSRKKKHVFAGIAIISIVFVVPLYFMTIGILSILYRIYQQRSSFFLLDLTPVRIVGLSRKGNFVFLIFLHMIEFLLIMRYYRFKLFT
ncbi:hypothetical protein KSP40_PGU018264 [Platanthera guangdongensis]|uniref:Succinate dehydrogenase subunit 3 n=1 Tax=Platanthera guangdongensis TaxID=2320717 RepID=A0ABR2MDT3_9ASPA